MSNSTSLPHVYEALDQDPENGGFNGQPRPTRSIYALTRSEILRGVANRFVHSRAYILLYLSMAALSITTVILSLQDGCPGVAFFVLEVIINTTLILEVGIRFVALGKQFWQSPFNVVDLILTMFCALTLLILVFASCGAGSKEEQIFDTLLLVARNILQFGRLANVMRQSGQSIFSRPKPIDINAARRAGFGMELDVESDEEDEVNRPLVRSPILFDAEGTRLEDRANSNGARNKFTDMPRAAQAVRDRDAEDMWAELG
ncbi:hypothetical protein CC1G_01810 [Coprinopsis cinerea okayama7|uniref:Ion transport domain-containing protein n=1 Tax=Coprinopsis cinerea (strain Okayama-7 / 130 / ATCC MYA-4618 / FGSC 9003) TaxID=240176 RepID=A8N2F7_COPC7|nr:hypothetical protein CC1G_01810 [Coprinopsis cinerea okayama7\|eukprot:XP_001829130.2 hypothetical protein CC1G_01810 [Coprinopsis cinerea okayama7\